MTDRSFTLGLIGSFMLAGGVFAPIVRIPLAGGINYFRNGQGDGVLILILALLSLWYVFRRRFASLWTTGFASLALLAYTFYNISQKLSEMQASMNEKLADNPFRGLAEAAMGSVQLEWGWAVLVAGSGVLIAAAALRATGAPGRKCPYCAEVIQPDAIVCKHCKKDVPAETAVAATPNEPLVPRKVAIETLLLVFGAPFLAWLIPLVVLYFE